MFRATLVRFLREMKRVVFAWVGTLSRFLDDFQVHGRALQITNMFIFLKLVTLYFHSVLLYVSMTTLYVLQIVFNRVSCCKQVLFAKISTNIIADKHCYTVCVGRSDDCERRNIQKKSSVG